MGRGIESRVGSAARRARVSVWRRFRALRSLFFQVRDGRYMKGLLGVVCGVFFFVVFSSYALALLTEKLIRISVGDYIQRVSSQPGTGGVSQAAKEALWCSGHTYCRGISSVA